MELSLAQTVLLPAIVAVALLLLPRGSWCIERAPAQVAPWTAGFALPSAILIAVYLIEGAPALALTQRWHAVWLAALVFAVTATPAAFPLHMPRNQPFLLGLSAALAMLMLRLPNLDSWTVRILLAVVGALFAGRVAAVAEQLPRASTLVIATSMTAITVMLLAAGSLKAGLIAASIACASGAALFVTLRVPTLLPGGAFAASAMVVLFSLAWYGAAYHGSPAIRWVNWAAIAGSGVFICLVPLNRSGPSPQARPRRIVIAATTASCVIAVATAFHTVLVTA